MERQDFQTVDDQPTLETSVKGKSSKNQSPSIIHNNLEVLLHFVF